MNQKRKRPHEDSSGQSSNSYAPQHKKVFVAPKGLSSSESEDESNSPSLNTPSYAAFLMRENKEENESKEQGTSETQGQYSSFAQRQMESMGYKAGEGLGKRGQGMSDILDTTMRRGRRGLGFEIEGFDEVKTPWIEDEVVIDERREAIPSCDLPPPTEEEMQNWCQIGKKKLTINDETEFCSPEVLEDILSSKSVFDALTGMEFLKARTRANPYEFIKSAIFQNRAAVKMVNMDSAFDFMFTNPRNRKGEEIVGTHELLYFADICAGPGGFSEYVLWRKKWKCKGFGLTLKGDCDFKLENFLAGTPETFEPHYGVGGKDGDGDIFNEDNLEAFKDFVMDSTDGKGVHFVMADGGFSVDGQENIQEILSKQLYLCQFLCALSILREGGHFVCKLFDLFTPFSMGLIYLLYRAFDEVFIFKPVTSRPANSERYVVCKFLRDGISDVYDYMFNLNVRINRLKGTDEDVMQAVPLEIMKSDKAFFQYMKESNDRIGKVQTNSLRKLRAYVQDPSLMGPYDQVEVRKKCLNQWKIPLQARSSAPVIDPDVKFHELWKGNDDDNCLSSEPTQLTQQNLQNLKYLYDYKCVVSGGERYFLLGVGRSVVYKWNGKPNYSGSRWSKLDKCTTAIPKDTLIDAEIVSELQGEGKGQRRSTAIHILDVIVLGGIDVRDKHQTERISMAQLFAKALKKPTRQDLVPLRVKQSFRLEAVKDIFNKFEMRFVKGRREPRECFSIDDEKHFIPRGIYFTKHIQEPWTHCFSKSRKMLYFYNKQKRSSTYECPKDSIASFKTSLMSRYLWLMEEIDVELEHGTRLERSQLLEFIQTTHRNLVGQ
ncbi:cap-specific mRNA (nucleoside-2'-O-)-methyltransferase 1-like [Actinia tenebrosa]|uniref:Cap-specific mRNA (nucleoside-2'-O-)-methyltransferase 1 n=1 Tax=Actinia tenebrosa TaxID=6105 RepID=A0A6P8I399_ACTTE|nr:cap-specific mRNA (nucleoside-2'-O-)-methyltransferase 1-like [Actinia tenebrosa]